jgi:hypothetical protein
MQYTEATWNHIFIYLTLIKQRISRVLFNLFFITIFLSILLLLLLIDRMVSKTSFDGEFADKKGDCTGQERISWSGSNHSRFDDSRPSFD